MSPLDAVARQAGEWLRGVGPQHEIVISTRIRLARNIKDFVFLSRADADTRAEIADTIQSAIRRGNGLKDLVHVDVEKLDEIDRALLVERHLISRQHAEGTGARRVAFDTSEVSSIMINEEDHLRLQVMRSGFQLNEAWDQINSIDDALEQTLDYAFHPKYGYLTACPTNVGTGIRVSVMLHLPALRLTHELDKVAQAAKDLRLAIRGLHGEGTEALGDFFQISNQITLGKSEAEIIDEFRDIIIPKIVEYESAARQSLLRNRLHVLDDKIWRAMGALQNARLISSNEAMQYLSHVRMGLHVGRLKNVELQTLNELFLQMQPAHLQKLQGERLNGEQRSVARAALIRARLSSN
ncbi:MAG: protein arginine kinase [Phycisphaerae bacterium]|jgi:protein arginine kinase|nr:protein arginine kinase [Phycisphaerae bacterium]HOO17676.1 protein arginine kinase [Phycisphaerae bacterium]HRS27912.1 protein arginine kinase [Phycisphaerae bacterium]HRT41316.1 protein arginine kinase [Phycisphaerae bacterium]